MTTLDPRALEAAAEAAWRVRAMGTNTPNYPFEGITGRLKDNMREESRAAVTAYLAVTQPVVDTVEGLIALGDGTVIRDKHGDVSEKRGGLWCGYETAPCDAHRMSKYLPARVIWRPHESP